MKDGRPKRGMDRDLALKVLALCSAVKDALDDLLDTMFIIYQPDVTKSVNIGDVITLTVVAMNVVSYQWQYSNNNVAWNNAETEDAHTAAITFEVTRNRLSYYRRCVLTDADGNILYTVSGKLTSAS